MLKKWLNSLRASTLGIIAMSAMSALSAMSVLSLVYSPPSHAEDLSNSIENLPLDVLLHVFSFLEYSDILNTRLISKDWNETQKNREWTKQNVNRGIEAIRAGEYEKANAYFLLNRAELTTSDLFEIVEEFSKTNPSQYESDQLFNHKLTHLYRISFNQSLKSKDPALKNDPLPYYNLGRLYQLGYGYKQNAKKALIYFIVSTKKDLHFHPAQLQAAITLDRHLNERKNANFHYLRALLLGNKEAETILLDRLKDGQKMSAVPLITDEQAWFELGNQIISEFEEDLFQTSKVAHLPQSTEYTYFKRLAPKIGYLYHKRAAENGYTPAVLRLNSHPQN